MKSYNNTKLQEIIRYSQQHNSNQSINDIVKNVSEIELSARLEDEDIVMEILHKPQKRRGCVITDRHYVYCFRTHKIQYDNSQLCKEPIWDPYYEKWIVESPPPPKYFYKKDWFSYSGSSGCGVLSLLRDIKGCKDDITAIFEMANLLKVSYNIVNRPQLCTNKRGEMIKEAHAYSKFEDACCVYFILGNPHEKYCFRTEYGGESFWLCIWNTDYGRVQLFYTLQSEHDSDFNWWEPISPPYEMIIYNKDLIIQYPERDLHIHDEISRTDSSNSGNSIGTWVGDISHYLFIDWSLLKGRTGTVKYIFDPDKSESFKIGTHLLQQMKLIGIDLELHPIKIFRENITWL